MASARELRPDVVLMDVQMPCLDGVAATRQVVGEGPADVLVATASSSTSLRSRVQAGAVARELGIKQPYTRVVQTY